VEPILVGHVDLLAIAELVVVSETAMFNTPVGLVGT
jgi:hypothetical protein